MKTLVQIGLLLICGIASSQYFDYEWNPEIIKANKIKKAYLFDIQYSDFGSNINPDFINVEYEFDIDGNLIKEQVNIYNLIFMHNNRSDFCLYQYDENNMLKRIVNKSFDIDTKSFNVIDTTSFHYIDNLIIKINIKKYIYYNPIKSGYVSVLKLNDSGQTDFEVVINVNSKNEIQINNYNYYACSDSSYFINEIIGYYKIDLSDYSLNTEISEILELFNKISIIKSDLKIESTIKKSYYYDKNNVLIKRIWKDRGLNNSINNFESEYVINDKHLVERAFNYIYNNDSKEKIYAKGYAFTYVYW